MGDESAGKLTVYMWHCGDECCCSQPKAVWTCRNYSLGLPAPDWLWEGTWCSVGEHGWQEDQRQQQAELLAVAERCGVELNDEHGARECRRCDVPDLP
jgi:hypothetical protein